MNPQLSIIIVNFNGEMCLSDCVNSIKKYIDCTYEIILVDNASTDDSLVLIRDQFPFVNIVENKTNLGFAIGNNIGAKIAKGDFLLLLNNDAKLTHSLSSAINLLNYDKTVGVVGGLTKYLNDKIQPSYGYYHTPINIIFSWLSTKYFRFFPNILKRVETDISKFNGVKEVDWVSGAFLLTRNLLWHKINGMDEQYFMYVEDVDFCKRVKDRGFSIFFSDRICAIHLVRAGKQLIDSKVLLNTSKSYLIYIKKYYNNYWALFVQINLIIVFLLRAFIFSLTYLFKSSSNTKTYVGKYYFKAAMSLLANTLKFTIV